MIFFLGKGFEAGAQGANKGTNQGDKGVGCGQILITVAKGG
jgi:hypothetical protein